MRGSNKTDHGLPPWKSWCERANLVLVRFYWERLLHRLSASARADRFVLKGALLFTLWCDLP